MRIFIDCNKIKSEFTLAHIKVDSMVVTQYDKKMTIPAQRIVRTGFTALAEASTIGPYTFSLHRLL